MYHKDPIAAYLVLFTQSPNNANPNFFPHSIEYSGFSKNDLFQNQKVKLVARVHVQGVSTLSAISNLLISPTKNCLFLIA